jgi:uncharacterized membrane-anchored protein YitT (DUF2179 family)
VSEKVKKWLTFGIVDLIGLAIYVFAWLSFIAPNKAGIGGVTGIATLIGYIYQKSNLGTFTLLINIPIFILALINLPKIFCIKTGFTIGMSTLLSNYFNQVLPHFVGLKNTPRFGFCFAGALLMGLGIGTIFKVGGASGGSDIISNLILLKKPHLKIGVVLFIMDAVVILLSAFVYKDVMSALYGCFVSLVYTRVVDLVLKLKWPISTQRGDHL